MPRRPRRVETGYPYHVINRGNERRRIFRDADDYALLLRLLAIGKRRYALKIFGLVLMPNHFHAVIQPERDLALSKYMRWVLAKYATEFRIRTGTVGNGYVFQQRFWSDCIRDPLHFLTVLHYIEANPLRAGMVSRPQDWQWSSAALRQQPDQRLLDPLPITLPDRWLEIVADQQPPSELEKVRARAKRGRPVLPR